MGIERQMTVPLAAKQIYSDLAFSPFGKVQENTVSVSLGRYRESTPITINSEKIKTKKNYEKISENHGRSMTEAASSKRVVWGGSLPGDIYGARSLKGTAMYQRVGVQETGLSGYGLRTNGLMDDDSQERAIRASLVLRTHGLPTEKPVSIKKLNEILNLSYYASTLSKGLTWEKRSVSKWKKDVLMTGPLRRPRIEEYLAETDFIALKRDIQIDERLSDVKLVKNGTELREFLEPIFNWLRVSTNQRNNGLITGTPKPPIFSAESPSSIKKYFFDFLPRQMGTYMGRLHKLGLVHGFPHSQNWSMVGTLYDLDSVRGKMVFPEDKKPSGGEFVEDISQATDAISEVLNSIMENSAGSFAETFQAKRKMARNYIKERYGRLNRTTKFIFLNNVKIYGSYEHKMKLRKTWNHL